MSIVGVALNLSLNMSWSPNFLSTGFNDNTYFTWNYCTPPSTALWYSSWEATGATMPAKYLGIQVMADASKYVFDFNYGQPSVSFTMAAGPASLQQVLNAIYTATQSKITASQYQQVTGAAWSTTAGTQPTLAQCLTDYFAQFGGLPQFGGLCIAAPGSIIVQD